MLRYTAVLLSAALVLASPARSRAQAPSHGPLSSEEGAPLQRLGYTPMTEGADPVGAGLLRADLWMGYSNIFEQDSAADHNLYLDLERLLTAMTVRYGIAEAVEVGARATFQTDWGGFLDGVVEELHDALGLGNRSRPDFPRGAYGQSLQDGDGRVLVELPRRTFGLEDVRLFGKWRAYRSGDGRRALSFRAVARVPTGMNVVGTERSDVGLMVLARLGWRRWHVHALAGGSSVRRSPELRDVLTGRQAFFAAAVEYPLRPTLSAVVQATGATQLLRSFDDHDVDGAPLNVIVGLTGLAGTGWRWELAFQEDAPPRGPSLDFTLQLALSRTW